MIQETLIYHKSREVLHKNCEKPRAYYIPYQDAESALADNRAYSKYLKNLCGDWDFAFYATPRDLPDFTEEGFTEYFEKVTVPGSWQTYLSRGYDTPNYTNVNYPFPFDPPHVP
ncbi:MAG: glycoside hydrolase family 2, partial [Clostridia bacterium]|nr:glycoside hydrolase family 2 [Clostridia bacterium]